MSRHSRDEPRPAADGLDSVVLGTPIVGFDWKPPASVLYRPDTIVDGWATDRLVVRCASLRGYGHRWDGSPRQDDVAVAAHPPTGGVLFAVADGLSSAPRSHEGATTVCDAAMAWLRHRLDVGGEMPLEGLLTHAALTLVRWGRGIVPATGDDTGEVARLFSTTLIAGVAMPQEDGSVTASVIQAGDSSAWVLRADGFIPVSPAKLGETDAVVDGAVSTPLPALPSVPPSPASVTLEPGEVLLVGTDGFGDPLGTGRGEVGKAFADGLREPPGTLRFASLLDFSRETYDDDRTLVALWPEAAS